MIFALIVRPECVDVADCRNDRDSGAGSTDDRRMMTTCLLLPAHRDRHRLEPAKESRNSGRIHRYHLLHLLRK